MDFSDPNHSAAELVFQGATEHDPAALCDKEAMQALMAWQSRKPVTEPSPMPLQLERALSFTITYDGKAGNYWPDESANEIGEGLVRDFLFREGVCALSDLHPRLYAARYKAQAVSGTEYLLVCPYPTSTGNIGGVLVVCVNKYLKAKATEA